MWRILSGVPHNNVVTENIEKDMRMNYLRIIIVGVVVAFFAGIYVAQAAEKKDVHYVSGEITWIDTNQGKLQLKNDASPSAQEVVEYRINKNDTRVTDPSDEKFLSIDDLRPGQHVTIDLIRGLEDRIVPKITADPRPAAEFQEAYGRVESIDGVAGKLVIKVSVRTGEKEESNLSSFAFEPASLVALKSPSRTPVQLEVKPGDLVKVEYVIREKQQWARSVTLYAPRVISTTTTTVTTTR